MYKSTKTYGHEVGLSCCFRQHLANSHCRLLHGYALAVKLVFEAEQLNDQNWVMDFGALKPVREYLITMFDHKLLVAEDDPMLDELCGLQGMGLAEVIVVEKTGCEAFAEMIYEEVRSMLPIVLDQGFRVRLTSVEVREHGANSAIYAGENQ